MGNTQPNSWSETNIKAQTIRHQWKVTNFSLCLKPTGDCIISEFSYDNQRTKWGLNLYPFGDKEAHQDYVSLHLLLLSAETEQVVGQGRVAILGMLGDSWRVYNFEAREFSLKKGYVINLSKRSDLFHNKDSVLPNDTLTVFLKLKYETGIESRAGMVTTNFQSKTKIDLHTRLLSLQETGQFCDIIVKIGETKFYLHRVILAAASPVFHQWFQGSKKSNELCLTGQVTPEIFKKTIDFIYGGKVPELKKDNLDTAERLVAAANYFKLGEMKSALQQVLTVLISIDTVPALLVMADRYQASKLKINAIEFIKANISEVSKTKQWHLNLDGNPKLLQELFQKLHN